MLTDEQNSVLFHVIRNKNIFLSGVPGSGKSFTLSYIVQKLESLKIKFGLTATTGTAAVNINGQTIHSFFGLKPFDKDYIEHVDYLKKERNFLYNRLLRLQCLIIEEISMLDNVLFDGLSQILKIIKKNDKPFGNIQVIFVGDFYQLKPIDNDFCFLSETWNQLNIVEINLKSMIRQKNDPKLQEVLTKIRKGEYHSILESLINTEFPEHIKPTKLFPKNKEVDLINSTNLKQLNKPFKEYIAKFHDVPFNNEYNISICEEAQIMITRNLSIEDKIVNGTRAVIKKLGPDYMIVQLFDGKLTQIQYYKDYINKEKTKWIEFMPIKVAYAISIHKSQGATLDAIEVDLGKNIFADGQAYVALSRAKKLENIKITNLSKSSFKIDKRVLERFE